MFCHRREYFLLMRGRSCPVLNSSFPTDFFPDFTEWKPLMSWFWGSWGLYHVPSLKWLNWECRVIFNHFVLGKTYSQVSLTGRFYVICDLPYISKKCLSFIKGGFPTMSFLLSLNSLTFKFFHSMKMQ